MTALEQFSALIADLRASGATADRLVAEAEEPFRALLRPQLLPSVLLQPDRIRTARYVLHRSESVTVFAVASAPGTVSDIHDHGAWGLVGQILGQEVEHAYRIEREDYDGISLERMSSSYLKAGDVTAVVPPDRDVHQVITISQEPSVSLHAFAHDLVHRGFVRFPPTRYSAQHYTGHWDNEEP